MMDSGLAESKIIELKKHVDRLHEISTKLYVSAESGLPQDGDTELERSLSAYFFAITAALDAKRIISIFLGTQTAEVMTNIINTAVSGVEMGVSISEGNKWITCRIMAPPMLKARTTARQFFELICLDLEREIVRTLPENFVRFSEVFVIFLHFFDASKSSGRPLYYDNDNIAVKGILDAVIQYVCLDDATRFCDNIYLSQPGMEDCIEVHVIQKGKLFEWVKQHEFLSFSKEFLLGTSGCGASGLEEMRG